MKKLTAKQQSILDFIRFFSIKEGMAPTVYEIASHFGVKSSTVFIHLRSLQKKHFLTRTSQARSIRLVGHPNALTGSRGRKAAFPKIPLVSRVGADPGKEGCRLIPFSGENSAAFSLRSLTAVRLPETAPGEAMLREGDIVTLSSDQPVPGDAVLFLHNGKFASARVADCDKQGCSVESCAGTLILPLPEILGILVELRRPLSRI